MLVLALCLVVTAVILSANVQPVDACVLCVCVFVAIEMSPLQKLQNRESVVDCTVTFL